MKAITSRHQMSEAALQFHSRGDTIGFVPTMGALHKGHLSLVNRSSSENDHTIVSIFVNPTQFNNQNDFDLYPRMEAEDLKQLDSVGCDVVFLPSVNEILESPPVVFDLGGLDKTMEGKFRPGHFQGVADIVTRFFKIINPHKAYFGLKDYQQLRIIRHVTQMLGFTTKIIECPTERELDGLAMSSRNLRLNPESRKQAPAIYAALRKVADSRNTMSPQELKATFIREVDNNPLLRTEYFEIVDPDTLLPVGNLKEADTAIACTAVYAGEIRLIDNIYL